MNEQIISLIERRRRQIWVHSVLYYEFNETIVTDYIWAKWAKELMQLQISYPKESKLAIYYDEFKDFEPSTGYNLSLRDPWAVNRAQKLLEYERMHAI